MKKFIGKILLNVAITFIFGKKTKETVYNLVYTNMLRTDLSKKEKHNLVKSELSGLKNTAKDLLVKTAYSLLADKLK